MGNDYYQKIKKRIIPDAGAVSPLLGTIGSGIG
jgi:hypothetical protein